MTVSNQGVLHIYETDGENRVWPVNFPYADGTDLHVFVYNPQDGTETEAETGFSLEDGAIIFPTEGKPVCAGQRVIIRRVTPRSQLLDLKRLDILDAEALEKSLDKTVMQIQELAEETARAIKFPVTGAAETDAQAYLNQITSVRDEAVSTVTQTKQAAQTQIVQTKENAEAAVTRTKEEAVNTVTRLKNETTAEVQTQTSDALREAGQAVSRAQQATVTAQEAVQKAQAATETAERVTGQAQSTVDEMARYAQAAEVSKTAAQTAQTDAQAAKTAAETARDTASGASASAADNAAVSVRQAQAAQTSAGNAKSSAVAAAESAAAALSSKNAAAQSAQQAAQQAAEAAQSAAQAAVTLTQVQEAGSTQTDAINAAGITRYEAVHTEGTKQVQALQTEGTAQTDAVKTAGAEQKKAVNAAAQAQLETITQAGSDAVQLAKDWASKTDGPVADGAYSAKKYAQDAANSKEAAVQSAQEAAGTVEAHDVNPQAHADIRTRIGALDTAMAGYLLLTGGALAPGGKLTLTNADGTAQVDLLLSNDGFIYLANNGFILKNIRNWDGSGSVLWEKNKGVARGVASLDEQGKVPQAQLPASFIPTDYIVETGSSGGQWYRKYKSGWVEQGGSGQVPVGGITVTYLKPFADTSYSIVAGQAYTGSESLLLVSLFNKTATSALITAANINVHFDWYACGQGA